MTTEFLIALAGFALASSITPGPNNLMLMASGANFGFRRTVPHMLGISAGFGLMVFLVGVGLAQLFVAHPIIKQGMTVLSVAYMTWLAWKIATAAPVQSGQDVGKPFTFWQAAAFQWVNPKAWAMGLTAVTTYAYADTTSAMLVVALVFSAINLPSVSVWTIAGQQIKRILSKPTHLRAFNFTMAALLLASMALVLL
ncbi:MAG: LysE family translocator [Ahrensia sp.]